MADTICLRVEIETGDGPVVRTFEGRVAWTLARLIDAGAKGITPVDRPAPRWSHYVFCLRREGLNIATIDEPNSGPFRGMHGRYVLRSIVRVLEARAAA